MPHHNIISASIIIDVMLSARQVLVLLSYLSISPCNCSIAIGDRALTSRRRSASSSRFVCGLLSAFVAVKPCRTFLANIFPILHFLGIWFWREGVILDLTCVGSSTQFEKAERIFYSKSWMGSSVRLLPILSFPTHIQSLHM